MPAHFADKHDLINYIAVKKQSIENFGESHFGEPIKTLRNCDWLYDILKEDLLPHYSFACIA